MYLASLIVVVSVGLMVLLWAGFMVWGFRSGQFQETQRLRRMPLDDETPEEQEPRGEG